MIVVQHQQRKILIISFVSAVILNIYLFMFLSMVPLIYAYYRYGQLFIRKTLLYTFIFSVAILLMSDIIFIFSRDSGLSISDILLQFMMQCFFIASLCVMLLFYTHTSNVPWQIRLPFSTFIVFFAMILVLPSIEAILQNSSFISELATLIGTDSEQVTQFYLQLFEIFKYNFVWISMLLWFLINWFIAITILSRRYTKHPNNYFNYLFEKIKQDFISKKFFVLTLFIFLIHTFLFSDWKESNNFFFSGISLFSGNFLSILFFLYVIRGIVVLYILFMYRVFVRIDLYFIIICATIFIPKISLFIMYVLFFLGILQDILRIENIRRRQGK